MTNEPAGPQSSGRNARDTGGQSANGQTTDRRGGDADPCQPVGGRSPLRHRGTSGVPLEVELTVGAVMLFPRSVKVHLALDSIDMRWWPKFKAEPRPLSASCSSVEKFRRGSGSSTQPHDI